MQTITTLGKHRPFSYSGSVQLGITLHFPSGDSQISAEFLRIMLNHFKGQTLAGGFSMTEPTSGGLGEWIQANSQRLNVHPLTPRHGSFIAAVLVHESFVTYRLKGNAVYLQF